jgi:hypothetical protein
MSQLQVVGVVIALAFLIVGGRALRREREGSFVPVSLVLSGMVVGLVAVFPGIAAVINDVLAIGRFTGSRLITLLILAVLVLWTLLLVVTGRIARLNRQFDRYVRRGVVREFLARNPQGIAGAVLCVVPAFNEEQNLREILPRFPRSVDDTPVRVVVINDGSTDGTSSVAEASGCLLAEVPVNRGGGAALRTGFDIAVSAGARAVVTIDADGQNDPEAVTDLARPILDGSADVIIGSRILGAHEITHWWRHWGVVLFSRLINLLMGTRITDCSSGFRAIRTAALPELRLFQDQYHTSEFIILAAKKGLRIQERPIIFRRRISGSSKKGPELLYAFRFFYVLTTTWLRGR